jgi:exonuclease III
MEGGQPGLRLLTWNVNGVRSLVSFPAWLTNQAGADIVCLQGTGFQKLKIIFCPFRLYTTPTDSLFWFLL